MKKLYILSFLLFSACFPFEGPVWNDNSSQSPENSFYMEITPDPVTQEFLETNQISVNIYNCECELGDWVVAHLFYNDVEMSSLGYFIRDVDHNEYFFGYNNFDIQYGVFEMVVEYEGEWHLHDTFIVLGREDGSSSTEVDQVQTPVDVP